MIEIVNQNIKKMIIFKLNWKKKISVYKNVAIKKFIKSKTRKNV